jgi:hypothetical protein
MDAGQANHLIHPTKVDEHAQARSANGAYGKVVKVVEELGPVRELADRVDAPIGVLELDLGHDHRREVMKGGKLLRRRGPGFGA